MVRIAGVDLKDYKKVEFALIDIFGIGKHNVLKILGETNVDKSKRIRELTEEELSRIQKEIEENYTVEGDLRREIAENIKRLRVIGTYRGLRHGKNLPVRGQRTRSNARTKRGKRKTVGAMKKEERAKMRETGEKK